MPVSTFRFDDPDLYTSGTPYEWLACLRKNSPFAWAPSSQVSAPGFWLATKYSDIVQLSKDPSLFSTHGPLLADPVPRELWRLYPSLAMIANNLTTADHVKHSILKPAINCIFSHDRLDRLRLLCRDYCVARLSDVFQRPRFDLADDLALPLATDLILGMLLGVPNEDLPRLRQWILTINAMDDPYYNPHRESFLVAARELYDYGIAMINALTIAPGHGVLNQIVNHMTLANMSAEEIFMAYWFPLAAGAFDTTASVVAGGCEALLQHPQAIALLQQRAELIVSAVEEMIRWVSPVIYFRRTATSDTMFRGEFIRKGDKIVLCYASANRDEEAFDSPDEFNVQRTPNHHLAFGYGPHYCLGAKAATTVLHVFFEALLPYLALMELEGPVIRTRSAWMNRVRTMPVRISPIGRT